MMLHKASNQQRQKEISLSYRRLRDLTSSQRVKPGSEPSQRKNDTDNLSIQQPEIRGTFNAALHGAQHSFVGRDNNPAASFIAIAITHQERCSIAKLQAKIRR